VQRQPPMPQAIPAPYPYPAAVAAPYAVPQPVGPNPFTDMGDVGEDEEDDRPRGRQKKGRSRDEEDEPKRPKGDGIRVRKPKTRSNLPLVIFGGVALVVLLIGVGSIIIWFGTRQVNAAKELEPKFDNASGMTMVKIPPGDFTMGSPDSEEGREDNEGPTGKVTLTRPFYISTTEVTQGQYLEIMGSTPSLNVKRIKQSLSNRMPVDNVTYDQALEFCRRLTGKESGRRPGWGYRLATEAEWEYCARAGTTTPFAFGNVIQMYKHGIFLELKDDPCWEPNPEGKTRETKNAYPVAGKAGEDKDYEDIRRQPNAFGLFDMHGNLWEWCSDYYSESLPGGERTDPTGPETAAGGVRVIRGGAWNEGAKLARSASRSYHDPKTSTNAIGFRVVFAEIKK
jgi:formylglycine-generating enzyme required for sulfatase activity